MDEQPTEEGLQQPTPPSGAGIGDASPTITEEPRRRRGCRGCALGCLITLGAFVLIVALAAGWFFNVPVRWGLVASPAEEFFDRSSNPWAERDLEAELAAQGIALDGIWVMVQPNEDGSANVAYILVDDAAGADWKPADYGYKNAVEGFLVLTATSKAAERYDIERVAVDHRDMEGVQAAVMTAPTSVIQDFAAGTITKEQMFQEMDGYADLGGVMGGMSEE
jgi:hypothetical protein